jgi:surfeit locus 1 family protein
MSRRLVVFVVIAIAVAAGCVRLGFWQLSRLAQRRERNTHVSARLAEPLVELTALAPDSASRLRRARVTGTLDYDRELVLAARSFEGSPGVHLFTPVRIAGRDTAMLVNRGWIYAPDGVSVDLRRWRERGSTFSGYAELLPTVSDGASAMLRDSSRIVRRLDYGAIARALPYPVSRLYLVATAVDSATPAGDRVARLPPPALDEGPHLGYALQWFSFAAIALVGAAAVVIRTRAERELTRVPSANGKVARW